MNTKAELKDYLRRARSDIALRSSMLGDARFLKKFLGWLALVIAFLLILDAVYSDGLLAYTRQSGVSFMSLIVNLMIYDKFADRVAMLESMEEAAPATGPRSAV